MTRRKFLKNSAMAIAAVAIAESCTALLPSSTSSIMAEGNLDPLRFPDTLKLQHLGVTPLKRDPVRLVLVLKDPLPSGFTNIPADLKDALSKAGFVSEDTKDKTGAQLFSSTERVNNTNRLVWIRSQNGGSISEQQIISSPLQAMVVRIAPVYHDSNLPKRAGFLTPFPHVLLIKPVQGRKISKARAEAFDQKLLKVYDLVHIPERTKYSGDYRYYVLKRGSTNTVFTLHKRLLLAEKDWIQDIQFEIMPMVSPATMLPNDTHYGSPNPGQWNLWRIGAGTDPAASASGSPSSCGWDITTGTPEAVVWLIDQGCDPEHPDLNLFSEGIWVKYIDLELSSTTAIVQISSLPRSEKPVHDHGTRAAGIIAAKINNSKGIAGLAGGCKVLPLTVPEFTDAQVQAAFNYAAEQQSTAALGPNVQARVINLSAVNPYWSPSLVDDGIQNAHGANIVICVAAGNSGSTPVYPATNDHVMACGACDMSDQRKASSNFGNGLSIVAPGEFIPTTDLTYDAANPTRPEDIGRYQLTWSGTSAAAPHVAGLAALLLSQYPSLNSVKVRNIIERTADKINPKTSANPTGYDYQEKLVAGLGGIGITDGTWCPDVGYGRINVCHALNFADVMIKDWPDDDGTEPSNPPGGNFWDTSDIVIRPVDDDLFDPLDPPKSRVLKRLQDNFLYVRVTNLGPAQATNVNVLATIAVDVEPSFVFPGDWTSSAPLMFDFPEALPGTPFTITVGGNVTAKFKITQIQIENLVNAFKEGMRRFEAGPADPKFRLSVIAWTVSKNDHAFNKADQVGVNLIARRNNIAQRTLSILPLSDNVSPAVPGGVIIR